MDFNKFLEYIINNKEWLFSGIGVTIAISILGIIKFVFRKRANSKNVIQTQKNGNNSINVQVGGDYSVREDQTGSK